MLIGRKHSRRSSLYGVEVGESMACHRCGSQYVVRDGICAGRQRITCQHCNRGSNTAVDSPVSGPRYRGKVEVFARSMRLHLKIRKSAEVVGICLARAFRRNHWFFRAAD